MSKFIINGPTKLHGDFYVLGSKNATLPILASSILFDETVSLRNVPDISDVVSMIKMLEFLGKTVAYDKKNRHVTIMPGNLSNKPIPAELTGKIRASILFLGPLIGRFGEAELSMPGGDIIGARPLATHFDGLAQLSVNVDEPNGKIRAFGRPVAADITLAEMSVTATENLVAAAVMSKGTTTIRLAACEPHVTALCEFFVKAGVKIDGVGTHTLSIHGGVRLTSLDYFVPYDYLEAGTLAVAAAATKSELTIHGFVEHDNDAFLQILRQIGVRFEVLGPSDLKIKPSSEFHATNVRTDVYPGFPSDLQAPLAILLTQANGTSELFETLYEGRLNYFSQLTKMGANCTIRDTHTAVITGPTPLYGTDLISIDVRAGATMVVAALLAEGTSLLDHVEHIDRGYEQLDSRLNKIGAHIERLD